MTAFNILIAGGTGFIGQALVHDRLQRGDQVTILGRSTKKINTVFNKKVKSVTWEELSLKKIAEFDIVINLAGENISDKIWTRNYKKRILSSRIDTTEKLSQLCGNLGEKSPRLFNASAIGIYGLQQSTVTPQDENTIISYSTYPDFLSEVGKKWEQATRVASDNGVNVINLRFAVVLSPKGGMLKKLLPTFKLGLGQIIGSGQQCFSWVSLQDITNSINFLINQPKVSGPINIVAPEVVSQKTFANTIAKLLHKPCFFKLPAFVIKIMFGQMGKELLLNGQNIRPLKLEQLGYKFLVDNLSKLDLKND